MAGPYRLYAGPQGPGDIWMLNPIQWARGIGNLPRAPLGYAWVKVGAGRPDRTAKGPIGGRPLVFRYELKRSVS
jgi:hypothetical protein